MRVLACGIGLLIIGVGVVVGVVGVVAPDRLMVVALYVITPAGLYAIGALRVGMGLVLMLVAPTSRAPKTVRALGAVVLVAGVLTPVVGVDRVRGIAEWGAAQGPALPCGVALVMMAVGSFIAVAVTSGRRHA